MTSRIVQKWAGFLFPPPLSWAEAGQAICQGHRVRHSCARSQPGLDVPTVPASWDSLMSVSCSDGGPSGKWGLILAASAVSASASYDFIPSVLSKFRLCRTTPYPLHLQLKVQVAQSGVYFSYSNGSSNSNTISSATIKFSLPLKRSCHIMWQPFFKKISSPMPQIQKIK